MRKCKNDGDGSKIIKFPLENKNMNNTKTVKKKKKLYKFLTLLFSALAVVVAIIIPLLLNKRSEVETKPKLDISIEYYEKDYYKDFYLDKRGQYLDKLYVKMEDNNAEPVDIKIEPFFNIVYYNQSMKTLIKQLLPIYDLKGMGATYLPFSVKSESVKNDILSKIEINDNTLGIMKDMANLFEDSDNIDYLNFFNEFPDSIITSIDLELYIIISYNDVYDNNYTEVYLCETGYKNFSGYLTDIKLGEGEADKKLEEYIVECLFHYSRLKVNSLENMEFNVRVSKISSENKIYKKFHQYYLELSSVFGANIYVPNMYTDLDEIINTQYENKCLLFLFDEENNEWKSFEKDEKK